MSVSASSDTPGGACIVTGVSHVWPRSVERLLAPTTTLGFALSLPYRPRMHVPSFSWRTGAEDTQSGKTSRAALSHVLPPSRLVIICAPLTKQLAWKNLPV